MTTIEMINKKSEVKFFTVWQHYEESFIEQMQEQGWILLGIEKTIPNHRRKICGTD